MSGTTSCPACDGESLTEIYRLGPIPVQSCVLLDSRDAALAFRRHELVLLLCENCGFIFNANFDLSLVDYASMTEESQCFSGTFTLFAKELIAEIASLYDLEGKQTLEVGCGKGDFLQELVQRTKTIGVGIDPGFIPERLPGVSGHEITFRREYFDPATITVSPDFVVCRHTLEHIPEVGNFIADIAAVVDGRRNTRIFFETPDVRRVLAEGAFWDIYFEHCSYFTLGSHARLFRRAGFNVTGLYLGYHGQYIIQHAEPGGGGNRLPQEDDLTPLRALAAQFPVKVAEIRARWTDFVRNQYSAGRRVAIWGGGSKAVSFLTTNGLIDEVAQVIDINPYKQGKFLPGTGHQVVGPEALIEEPPDVVIVMNPVYLPEVRAQLAEIRLAPQLMAL